MSLIVFAFPLAILALVAVAIYEHVTSIKLSLPLSPVLTFLTILLPLLAAVTTSTLPYLTTRPRKPTSSSSSSSSSSLLLRRLTNRPSLLLALHLLQALLTTVLATLYFEDAVATTTTTTDCALATRWQHLFRTKDAPALRAVQDALDCCGFRSVRDMAWPFPPADGGPGSCAARFGRGRACRAPWARALRRGAGGELGVVLAVGVLQIVSILIARHLTSRNPEGFSWGEVLRRAVRRRNNNDRGNNYASRPLLTNAEEVDEEVGRGVGPENGGGYGALAATENDRGQEGPRLEPSGLRQERNEWRD